jgi:hypothetical protein
MSLSSLAQPVNLGDSLKYHLDQDSRFIIRLDTRNSFITGRSAQIRGVKAGLCYGDRFTFGIGYNWLKKGFDQNLVLNTELGMDTINSRLHFSFVSPFVEYVFYVKNGFSVALPVQIGLGASWLSYRDDSDNRARTNREFVMLYEPAMTIEQRFLKYFSAGFGFGYRLMLKNNSEVDAQFTSAIYLIRLRILFSEIYKNLSGNID